MRDRIVMTYGIALDKYQWEKLINAEFTKYTFERDTADEKYFIMGESEVKDEHGEKTGIMIVEIPHDIYEQSKWTSNSAVPKGVVGIYIGSVYGRFVDSNQSKIVSKIQEFDYEIAKKKIKKFCKVFDIKITKKDLYVRGIFDNCACCS